MFDEAERRIDLKTVYVNTDTGSAVNSDFIRHKIPDYQDRTFYISGSRGVVVAFREMLYGMGVPGARAKTAFFPGFV